MDDLIQRLRVEPTASQFLRTGDLVESLVAERKEAAARIAALEAEKAEREQNGINSQWLTGVIRRADPKMSLTSDELAEKIAEAINGRAVK